MTTLFHHPALFYRGADDYLAGTVPFVRSALSADEPVAVAVPPSNLRLLQGELGSDADRVRFVDMTRAGRNPGRIIGGVLRKFADAHPDRTPHIIGEPIWAGRSDAEYPACAQHEALINLAFADRAVSILCPYDADGLSSRVLADAAITHPVLMDTKGMRLSGRYAPEHVVATYNQPLPAPARAPAISFDLDGLDKARRFAADAAGRHGLAGERASDAECMVGELATNSIVHGGGHGTLTVWAEDGQLICQVSDTGRLTEPLAGRIPAPPRQPYGRGLLLVNHLADLVRTHTSERGTTIRIHLNL